MKHILITGSTDGIGKLLALHLAKEGHFVAIHGRSDAKLAATLKEIKQQSNNENVIGFLADFSDLNAVKKMAEEVAEKMPVIDVLVNNAGVFKAKIDTAANGVDVRLVVNYLAPYQFTNAVLPLLKKADAPRIVNLSSAAQSPVSLNALQGGISLGANDAYAQSKLALTMWSFYLAKQEPSISVIAVNPGSLLDTKMAKEAYGQHWSPAEKGVDILYDLAMTDSAETGKYFDNDKGNYAQAHPDAYDAKKIEELLSLTNTLV
ncbi:Short-chain dehydrogenase [Maribacter aquivivus]|uniref:Short-chain dehydrogenase n=1 Tax=Maribacter aquivivus TaxID=228958 RepID=A0A1M6QKY6_9FLAO|nr:SDR family NAD(P)-dependent oxidoreductase [Maribacter aquivivus]SHK20770.1 Short-chain dehydrogenase [Maribacter aquivivus]